MQKLLKAVFIVVGVLGLFLIGGAFWAMADISRYNGLSPEEQQAERAASQAQREAHEREIVARNLRDHPDGRHCLSSWSGQHSELVSYFREQLREPDSFEHIWTRIFPVDDAGQHRLLMSYRARNGFGGMNVSTLRAEVANSDCSFRIVHAGS